MAVPRCTLATVRGRLIAALNAAPAATWVTTITSADDNRRNDTELDNIIKAADARICVARASRVGDGYRTLFLSLSASIDHGGMIPDHLGPIEQVTIKAASIDPTYKPGKFDPDLTLADIERWRLNAGGRYGTAHNITNSPLAGFYIRRGSQLFYCGTDAKCLIATFTRTAACQAPESDEDMLLGLSIGDAYKEGDMGTALNTLVADARAEYGNLLKQIEPNPSETVSLVAA